MNATAAEEVARWAIEHGLSASNADTLSTLLVELGTQLDQVRAKASEDKTRAEALATQVASIRALCESGWPRGEPCRFCKKVGSHSEVCYVRGSAGYDLLNEHEATLRENAELRAALAAKLPVNGKHLLSGERYVSLRQRVQGRFSRHED